MNASKKENCEQDRGKSSSAGERYKIFFIFGSIIVFLIIKLSQLTFRFGDPNPYFYMADVLLKGQLPYRDFFLADPPFLVLTVAFFKFFSRNNILFLQALPIFFESVNAFLVYLLLKKTNRLAFLGPLVYLFSFTILSTSDFLTGVQLTVMMMLFGLLLHQKKRPYLSGFFWSLACLTKLYAAPIFLGFGAYLALKKDWPVIWKTAIGFLAGFLVTLGPFFLAAPKKAFDYIIIHHFNRPEGLNKTMVWTFFFGKEWPLIIFAAIGAFVARKKEYAFPLAAGLVFLLYFRDLYFNYFGIIIPFLVLLALYFLTWLWENKTTESLSSIVLFFYACFMILVFKIYVTEFVTVNRILNAKEIASYAETLKDHDLYGSHEVTPLIALLSHKKLADNLIDTNMQSFGSGAQDLWEVSERITEKGVFLVARISRYPQYGITDTGFEGYFDEEIFQNYCHVEKEFPSTANQQDNLIVIYRCEKK